MRCNAGVAVVCRLLMHADLFVCRCALTAFFVQDATRLDRECDFGMLVVWDKGRPGSVFWGSALPSFSSGS